MTIKKGLKLLEKAIRTARDVLFLPPVYSIIGCLPRDKNLWVFTSRAKLYDDNSRLFFEWVNQNHPEIKAVWISKSDDVIRRIRDEKRRAFRRESLGAIFMFLRAGKAFTVVRAEDPFPLFLMNGTDWYELWHGMPLKQIGNTAEEWKQKVYSAAKSDAGKFISNVRQKAIPWENYKYRKTHRTITNSCFFIPFLMDAFGMFPEDVLKTGSPRCDALFFNRKELLLENLRAKFPGCKIILYMPTFRSMEKHGGIFDPFVQKYGFNEAELEKALVRNNCVLLYKAHAADLYKKNKLRDAHSRFLEISDKDYDELYNFVGQVDVLATDYSSIYFDFIATRKPVILCPFDYDDYIKYSRPHYFDYFENMEGVKAENWHEFIRILDEKSYYPVSEKTRIKFAEYLDVNCCRKVYDAVMALDKKK